MTTQRHPEALKNNGNDWVSSEQNDLNKFQKIAIICGALYEYK
jgi:hypothetical protein